jgi:hypothetical protein
MLGYIGFDMMGTVNPRYLAGLLITDDHGLPLDFRYTEPVSPNRVQQVLYGQGMTHYMKTQVLWPALLQECGDYDFNFIFTQDVTLLQSQVQTVGLVGLRETSMDTLTEDTHQVISPTECLLQVVKTGPPIKISWQSHLDQGTVIKTLKVLGQQMLVLEPFDRVQAALKLLGQEMAAA